MNKTTAKKMTRTINGKKYEFDNSWSESEVREDTMNKTTAPKHHSKSCTCEQFDKTTARPWSVAGNDFTILDGAGVPIAECLSLEDKETSSLIVRAVNEYDNLVESLETRGKMINDLKASNEALLETLKVIEKVFVEGSEHQKFIRQALNATQR
jgi:lysozyme family protein